MFSFHEFVNFVLFLLLMISSFNLWSDRMQGVVSVLFYLLRLALCLSMWSVLKNVLLDTEKEVYSVVFG